MLVRFHVNWRVLSTLEKWILAAAAPAGSCEKRRSDGEAAGAAGSSAESQRSAAGFAKSWGSTGILGEH